MGQRICSVDGCGRPVNVIKRGWCGMHYARWRKHGDVGTSGPLNDRQPNSVGQRTCSVGGCEKPLLAKGLCKKHWARLERHGTTDLLPRKPRELKETVESRFWSKVDKVSSDTGCWLWVGSAFSNGYGRIGVARPNRSLLAHRVSWEISKTPIPEGLEIDHLCRVRLCVNPDHLEPVTPEENRRRALPWREPHPNTLKTHCPQGHPYSSENTRINSVGARECRTCERARRRGGVRP